MVYTSIASYLDPSSWNQQEAHHLPGGSTGINTGGMAVAATSPGSMVDRARQAKLPQPEQALKCPRCDSINTKFCYFNNYSLSQPRHFCKTCRRYWTRGGSLRNVPVGGGYRRNNKRSKNGNPKSTTTTTASKCGTSGSGTSVINHNMAPMPQLSFMTTSQPLSGYGAAEAVGFSYNFTGNMNSMNYQMCGATGPGVGPEQWRPHQVQHYPMFTELESAVVPATTMAIGPDLSSVEMVENSNGLNLPRQYLGWSSHGGNGAGSGTGVGSSGTGGLGSCFNTFSGNFV